MVLLGKVCWMSGRWERLFRYFSSSTAPTYYIERQPSRLPGGETVSAKRARLLYQSKKRGILENDIILGGFASSQLQTLTESQLRSYDELINGGYNEWDIYHWIVDTKPVPDNVAQNDVFALLKKFAKEEAKNYGDERT